MALVCVICIWSLVTVRSKPTHCMSNTTTDRSNRNTRFTAMCFAVKLIQM